MKDFSNYKKHVEIDMKSYSGNFHFNEQLKQEGTNIKINDKSTQLIDGVEENIKAIVRNHGNEFNESKEERSIMIDKKYNYKSGDYIEYLGDIYLTNNSIDKDNPFFNTAKMTKCNYILKWVDEGALYEQPCIVINNTKYTGGTKVQNGFTEVSAMVNIVIQSNENTKKISYGKRLYTMKNAWQVTLIDNITTENTLSWTLGKDSLNSEIDDIENGICDAFEHLYAISLNSNSQTLVETETFKIIPNVTDNGSIVLNPNVIYTSSDESIAKVDNTGLVTAISIGMCDITCSIGNVNEVLNLTINAKPVTPVISYSCDWSTAKTSTGCSLKTYMSSTATLKKTINGIDDSTLMVNYTLDSIGSSLLSSGAIAITRKTNNSFLVKNVNISVPKSFVMTFIDNLDGTIIATQTIQLTGT